MDFPQGALNEKHQEIAESVVRGLCARFSKHEVARMEVSHCPESKQTFVAVDTSFEGSDHLLLVEHRLFVIGKRGGLRLLNGKCKSRDRSAGRRNVLWAPVR